jgi:hypothetical protein
MTDAVERLAAALWHQGFMVPSSAIVRALLMAEISIGCVNNAVEEHLRRHSNLAKDYE